MSRREAREPCWRPGTATVKGMTKKIGDARKPGFLMKPGSWRTAVKVAVWAAEVAKEFWARVGVEEPFPRNLRDPIRSLPLTLQPIPELTTARVFHWLQRVGIELEREDFEKEVSTGQPPFPFSPDRGLRGCLVARHGHGFLFVDDD